MKIVWGKDRIIVIEIADNNLIERSLETVDKALNGEMGFCYLNVPKIPLFTGTGIRNTIRRKRQEHHNELLNDRARVISKELKELKKKEKLHYLKDSVSVRKLTNNYNRLKKALTLLVQNGIVSSYVLTPTGRLKVNWFIEYQPIKTITIEQGFTYSYKGEPVLKTKTMIEKEYVNDNIFCGSKTTQDILPFGKVDKKYEGNQSLGPAGIDSTIMRYKKDQDVQIVELKEISDLFKDKTEEDVIQIMAWLMFILK